MSSDKPRVFFGSIEHSVGQDNGPLPTASIQSQTSRVMTFSDETMEEIQRHQQLIADLEQKKKMREIVIPGSDDLVKARLIELGEPIILFGEAKQARRERLRLILSERGLTEGNPTTVLRDRKGASSQIVQTDVIATPGPKELKEMRIKLTKSSLAAAKKRLEERRHLVEHMKENWDQHQKAFDNMFEYVSRLSESTSTVGDSRPLTCVAFNNDGTKVATTSWSGECKVWDIQSCKTLQKMNAHGQRAQCVIWNHSAASPSVMNLVTCGADDKIAMWALDSDKPLRILAGHLGRVNKVVLHPHFRWMGSTSFDKTWCLWDLETGKELFTQGGNSRAVYGLAFHQDGALVATAGLDAICRVWDMRSGRAIWNLRGHAKQIIGLDFAPNGYHVATGSDDRTVRIWDLRKKTTANIILAHNSLISTVKYQPVHGNYIVTSSFDNTAKFWSTKNWSLIKTFTGHEDKVSAVDVSPKSVSFPLGLKKGLRMKNEVKEERMDEDEVMVVKKEKEDRDYVGVNGVDGEVRVKLEKDEDEERMDVCFDDGDLEYLQGYKAPVNIVTCSFDRTWKMWEADTIMSGL